MKRLIILLSLIFGAYLLAGCGGTPSAASIQGLMSLDEAVSGTMAEVEKHVPQGTEIAITKIDAPLPDLSDFLNEELQDRFGSTGKMVVLARGQALESVNTEHSFQMSGLVDDESAVGIGHYLGAKVVITGTFDRFADFSQLRVRAIDVKTSALVARYSARIRNDDRVLANVAKPLETVKASKVTEDALAALNRGKDYFAEGKYDEAIQELAKALALNKDLSEAWFYRGTAYGNKGDYDQVIADLNEALRINPNYAGALSNRGVMYYIKRDYDRAIADFTAALRINPKDVDVLNNRGSTYSRKGEYDRAITDFTAALRINPNHVVALNNRGLVYADKKDYDRAIADFTAALQIDPNYGFALFNRGSAYGNKGEYDRAIADFTAVLGINPNDADALGNRGVVYADKKDYDRAIADFTAVLRINPNFTEALNERGIAYFDKKDYDRAIADFREAMRLDPSNQIYKYWLQMAQDAKAGKR